MRQNNGEIVQNLIIFSSFSSEKSKNITTKKLKLVKSLLNNAANVNIITFHNTREHGINAN